MNLKDLISEEKNQTEGEKKNSNAKNTKEELDQIASLLMQNRLLETENIKLRNTITNLKAETETTISHVKEDYRKKETDLEKRLSEAENIKNQALKMQKQYNNAILQKAKKLTEKDRDACQREYRQKINAVYAISTSALIYGTFVTLLTGISSVRFSKDLLDSLQCILNIIKLPFNFAVKIGKSVYGIGQMIPYATINIIIAGMLTALTFVATAAMGYGLIYLIVRRILKLYHDTARDIWCMSVALGCLAPLVQFADTLNCLQLNLVIVQLTVQAVYLIVRFAIMKKRNTR